MGDPTTRRISTLTCALHVLLNYNPITITTGSRHGGGGGASTTAKPATVSSTAALLLVACACVFGGGMWLGLASSPSHDNLELDPAASSHLLRVSGHSGGFSQVLLQQTVMYQYG